VIRATAARAVLVCVLVAGCGSDESDSAPEPSVQPTTASAEPTTTDAEALVGRWERTNQCPELVEAFEQAGLAELAPAFVGDFFPDSNPEELAQKDDLCEGADSIVHSHFFTDDGEFGSLTEELEQVDDGSYEITDEGTFVISKEFPDVTFHYEIERDSLMLTPVLSDALKEEALAHPLEFTAAGWALTMSYPGEAWKRVECSGWC
jgi:hypothetical protein